MFQALAKEDRFPPHQLADLRAREICTNATAPAQDQLPPYLQDLGLEISLKLAQTSGDKSLEISLLTEKAKHKLPQSEKIKLIKLALDRAHELNQDDKVKTLTKRLYQIAPRLIPSPRETDYLAVAHDFRLSREFEAATKYYERIVKGKTFRLDDKIQALRGLRQVTKNARQMDSHLLACHRLSSFLTNAYKENGKSTNLRLAAYDAQVFEARAQWTQGHIQEARKIFNQIEKHMKGRVPLGELYWLKARMAEEEKDYPQVAALLEQALKEVNADGSLRDKITWYAAWNERRLGNFDRAAQRLDELDQHTQDEFMRNRALFWLAKNLQDSKREKDAKPVFDRLMTLDPLGYYGLIAHRLTGQPIKFNNTHDTATQDVKPPTLDHVLADWLGQIEERDAMTALLDEASKAYSKHPQQDDDVWVTIFKYYASAGSYIKLYESLSSLSPEQRKSIMENHPELLFPQPWKEEVRLASLQFGVQEELIYSIMRQESAFDPRSRSLADAFGLLQILPEVAEQISRQKQIPYNEMEDLYDPQTNIRIGAAHLKDLLHRHNDQFILAVASYNANETAIRNWLKYRFRGDALEFIEEIPYEETRSYVRLVMRNLIFYSLLRSKSASIDFPNWVLNLKGAG